MNLVLHEQGIKVQGHHEPHEIISKAFGFAKWPPKLLKQAPWKVIWWFWFIRPQQPIIKINSEARMQGSESVLCRLGACFRRSVCETGGLETILRGSWRPCTLFLHEYKFFLGCLLKIYLHYIVRGGKNRDAIKYKKREYYIPKTFQDFVGYL